MIAQKTRGRWSKWRVAYAVLVLATAVNASQAVALPFESVFVIGAAAVLTILTWSGSRSAGSRGRRGVTVTELLLRNSMIWATAAVLLSLPLAVDMRSSLFSAASFLLFAVFVLGLSLSRWRGGMDLADLQSVAATSGLLLTGGLIAHLAGAPFTTSGYLLDGSTVEFGRYQGIFNNPNLAGLVGMVTVPLSAGLWLVSSKRLNIVWLVSAMATVYMSGSRTAFFCLVVAGAIVFMRARTQRRVFVASAVVILGVGVMAILLSPSILEVGVPGLGRAMGGGNVGTTVFNNRAAAWMGALTLISASPIVGYGFGGAPAAMMNLWYAGGSAFDGGSVHNAYLQWLVNVGIMGLPALIGVISVFALLLFRRTESRIGSFLSWGVGAGLIANLTESAMFGLGAPYAWIFWAIVVAAAAGVPDVAMDRESRLAEPGAQQARFRYVRRKDSVLSR